MKGLLNNLFATKTGKKRRNHNYKTSFQVLEDRKLMAVLASFDQQTLRLTGDEAGDKVEVVDTPSGRTTSGGHLQVFVNGTAIPLNGAAQAIRSFSGDHLSSGFHKIEAQLGGGNDSFSYRIAGGSNAGIPFVRTPLKTFDLNTGTGNGDKIDISYLDTNGAPKTLDRQDLNIFINEGSSSGDGRDEVKLQFGHLQDARVKVFANLGNGDDKFTAYQRGNLWSQSSLEMTVRGEAGRDKIVMETVGPECIIESPANVTLNLDGGLDADTTQLKLNAQLHGKLKIDATGGEGGLLTTQYRDDTRASITTTPPSNGSISARFWESYTGDEGDLQELTIALAQGIVSNQTRIDRAVIDGGAGVDAGAGSVYVSSLNIESEPGARALSEVFSRVAFRAVNGGFVAPEPTISGHLVSTSSAAGGLETFEMIKVGTERVGSTLVDVVVMRAATGKFLRAHNGGGSNLHASGTTITAFEKFRVIRGGVFSPVSRGKIALQTATGHYVCAEGGGSGRLVANRTQIGGWEQFEMVRL